MATAKVPQPSISRQESKPDFTAWKQDKHFLTHHLPGIHSRRDFSPAFLKVPPPVSQQRMEAIVRLRREYERLYFELEWRTLEVEEMLDKGSSVESGPLTCCMMNQRLHIWEDSGWPADHDVEQPRASEKS